MGEIIFWGIIIGYWAIGIKRMPTYYRRWYQASKKEWTHMTEQEHQRSGAWHAMGLVAIWPYYEGARWIRDYLIHAMTKEERQQQEYERAERIVKDYAERKKREEREEFERHLRG